MAEQSHYGEIEHYDPRKKAGVILASNGRRLHFRRTHFADACEPAAGTKVTFSMPSLPNGQGRIEIEQIKVIDDFEVFLRERQRQEENKVPEHAVEEAPKLKRERQQSGDVYVDREAEKKKRRKHREEELAARDAEEANYARERDLLRTQEFLERLAKQKREAANEPRVVADVKSITEVEKQFPIGTRVFFAKQGEGVVKSIESNMVAVLFDSQRGENPKPILVPANLLEHRQNNSSLRAEPLVQFQKQVPEATDRKSDYEANQLSVYSNKTTQVMPVQEKKVVTVGSSTSPMELAQKYLTDSKVWRQGWVDYKKIIDHYHIQALFHFTDFANITSIIQHGGLYSWRFCQENGISISRPGGNDISRELDCRRNLRDYVRLSFNPNSPMLKQALHEGRIEKPIMLRINPDVIYWESTIFSNMNATATEAELGKGLEDLKRINFDIVTQPHYSEANKSLYQAEVLVKTHIPIKYILNLPGV